MEVNQQGLTEEDFIVGAKLAVWPFLEIDLGQLVFVIQLEPYHHKAAVKMFFF